MFFLIIIVTVDSIVTVIIIQIFLIFLLPLSRGNRALAQSILTFLESLISLHIFAGNGALAWRILAFCLEIELLMALVWCILVLLLNIKLWHGAPSPKECTEKGEDKKEATETPTCRKWHAVLRGVHKVPCFPAGTF